MMSSKRCARRDGFSLIELVVVVAIIGLLSAIAVPNYIKFTGRTRQVEAKAALSGMFVAEQISQATNSTYTVCLYQAGYEPDGMNRYYTSGVFNGSICSSCNTDFNTGLACVTTNSIPWQGLLRGDNLFPANLAANPSMGGFGAIGSLVVPDALHFTLGAVGSISSWSSNYDIWSIDQDKVILNVQSGL